MYNQFEFLVSEDKKTQPLNSFVVSKFETILDY